jgi:putative alpha-1,2-mannosidase
VKKNILIVCGLMVMTGLTFVGCNGKGLNRFCFPASELLKGGSLVLEMGDTPDKNWGVVIGD